MSRDEGQMRPPDELDVAFDRFFNFVMVFAPPAARIDIVMPPWNDETRAALATIKDAFDELREWRSGKRNVPRTPKAGS